MQEEIKAPFYKKTWFIILSLILFFPLGLVLMWMYTNWTKMVKTVVTAIILLVGVPTVFIGGDDKGNKDIVKSEETTEEVTEEVSEEESTEEEPTEEESTEETAEESTEDPATRVPEVIADLNLTDVKDDHSEEWQKAVTSKDVNMPENAMAYYEEYMEDGDIHFIVTFATNTTINLNAMGGILFVTITEYQEGEEHDASELGSGMVYKEYHVHLNDGSVEEL